MIARLNPFNMQRIECIRFRPATGTVDEIIGRFEAMGRCGAIIGPKGHGKTTLLEQIAEHYRAFRS